MTSLQTSATEARLRSCRIPAISQTHHKRLRTARMQDTDDGGFQGFPGFGSPVPSRRDEHMEDQDVSMSPLLFRRTPGVHNTPPADSGNRFSNWVVSTSPYAGQKTPPTASMKSVAAGAADENTPPQGPPLSGGNSNAHFQAWLKATSGTRWTPRRSPDAATPPAAPAPTPATTPMSIAQLPASAASPATAEPRSRPIFDLAGSSSSDDDDEADGANTTVGVQQVAAGAARMRAALAAAGSGGSSSHAPPRAPAPTPAAPGHAPAGGGGPDAAAQLLQQAADSLASPMGMLSVSRAAARGEDRAACGRQPVTPGTSQRLGSRLLASQAEPPASPVDQVIGLMMEPAARSSGSQQHHQHRHAATGHHQGASRLATNKPPASPEQQLIQLMMRGGEPSAQLCGALSDAGNPPAGQQQQQAQAGQAQGSAGPARSDGFVDAHSDEGQSSYSSCVDDDDDDRGYGSDSGGSFAGSSGSGDDIDVAELQELCGAAAGTPISDIINMMLSPELIKGAAGLTPAAGAAAADEHAGVGPRVLFADD